MDRSAAPLLENAHAFLVMRNLYAAAGRQLTLKFEVLNSEFNVLYARNPIHHIESRVKSPESIAAKLLKKGLPLTLESAMQNVNDIAGVRVVCSYIDDVYRVAEMVERQQDLEIVKRQDYIKTPNYNGYRSLHLDLSRVPVYLSEPDRAGAWPRSRSVPSPWISGPVWSTTSATRLTAAKPARGDQRGNARLCREDSRNRPADAGHVSAASRPLRLHRTQPRPRQ